MKKSNLAQLGLLSIALSGGLAWIKAFPSKVAQRSKSADEIRLITLDPGHSHAAAIQNEMVPGISRKVDVYAPLGPDLIEHLNRIARFNTRKRNPTSWELEIHTGTDFLERMVKEHPGNVVVISGRNQEKIQQIPGVDQGRD